MPKHPYYDQSRREFWRITNITSNRKINIGDLPLLPTLEPNERCDLLRYYTKEDINQSENLPFLISKGWLRAKKNLDNIDTSVSRRDPKPYLTTTETNEVEAIEDSILDIIRALSSFIATGIITVTEDTSAGSYQIILCDATSGQITITLPSVTSAIRMYYIKKIDTSGNKVVIKGTGSDKIDNYDTVEISVSNNCLKIVSNGTAWWII
jgi:hypothetical protein